MVWSLKRGVEIWGADGASGVQVGALAGGNGAETTLGAVRVRREGTENRNLEKHTSGRKSYK